MTGAIIALIVLLFISALFSATETAFTSLSMMQIQDLKKDHGRRGRAVESLTKQPDVLLTTLLIGNNLANIGATALSTSATITYFGSHVVGFMTGGLTLIVLIFCEVTPKQIALAQNDNISLWMALPIRWLAALFRPFIWFISGISNFITKIFAGKKKKAFTLENLLQMVSLGENMGIIETYEQQMVKNVFRINDTSVKGITTHRTNVFGLDQESHIEDVIEEILDAGFSRIPIYKDNSENITGLVFIKDLLTALAQDEEGFKLKEKRAEVLFIPETRMVHDLFHQFKKEKHNMAIVLDEYGGLTGIVTKEDMIEEIFGELYDEDEERETDKIIKVKENAWLLQGETTFYEMQDYLGLDLEHDQKTLTLAGYLTEKMGQIPQEGDVLPQKEGTYTVKKVCHNRVAEVHFKKNRLPA